MKKFAMAAVAAAALSAGVAQAYTVGTFSNGFVVPNVIHNGDADTTAVGIVNDTGNVVPVFWTFFDQNSNHGVDGCFPMTNKQYTGFNWATASGVGMEGKRGYLVFAVGSGGAALTAATACAPANATLATQADAANSGQLAGNAFAALPVLVLAFVDEAQLDWCGFFAFSRFAVIILGTFATEQVAHGFNQRFTWAGRAGVVCYLLTKKSHATCQAARELFGKLSASWVFATGNNKGQATGEWCQGSKGAVWISQVSQAFRHILQGAGYAG